MFINDEKLGPMDGRFTWAMVDQYFDLIDRYHAMSSKECRDAILMLYGR